MDFQQAPRSFQPAQNLPQTPLPNRSSRRSLIMLIVLAAVVLAGGAGAYYFYYRPSTANSNSQHTTNTNSNNSNSASNTNGAVAGIDPEFSFSSGNTRYRYHDLANEIVPFTTMTPLATWNTKVAERLHGSRTTNPPESLSAGEAACLQRPENVFDSEWDPDDCFAGVALAFRSPLTCEKIPVTTDAQASIYELSWSRNCIKTIAEFYNPYDCNQHTTNTYRDQCLVAEALDGRYRTSDCSPITNVELKASCQQSVDRTKELEVEEEELDAANDDLLKALCYAIETPQAVSYFPGEGYQTIVQEFIDKKVQLPSTIACSTLSSEERARALSLLTTDADGDKLSVVFEKVYNGDDTKKDTDGDGFDDYTEVVAGFYPNEKGPATRMVGDDSLSFLYSLSKCVTENNGDITKCF